MKIKNYIMLAVILALAVTVAVLIFTRPKPSGQELEDYKRQKDSLLRVVDRNNKRLDSLEVVDAVKDSLISRKTNQIVNIYEQGKKDYYDVISLDASGTVLLWTERIDRERKAADHGGEW